MKGYAQERITINALYEFSIDQEHYLIMEKAAGDFHNLKLEKWYGNGMFGEDF